MANQELPQNTANAGFKTNGLPVSSWYRTGKV
jgi:hypothetical protein